MLTFEWIIGLLLAAVALSALARRIKVPYPTFLAIGGVLLTLLPWAPTWALEPELALALFVAPVLLDAAFDTSLRDLRNNWLPVSTLVVVAVGVTTTAVAVIAHWLRPDMPWPVAIALGAIVAPPDAAAATARRGDAAAPTCADVVTELARSAGKVSYDIAKDGHLAAVLTLARTRYRLGDAVHAVVRINLPTSRVRIVRLAASLETHEEVNAALAALPAQRMQRHTRQVYATHHESTLDTRQTSVQLTLPRGATPAFATSAVQLHWTLRVSLLTHTRADGGPAPAHIARAHDAYAAFHTAWERTPTLTADGARLEIVEASVPIGVLPSTARTKKVPIDMYA